MAEPAVRLDMVAPGHPLPGDADLIILPGSKATVADLRAFKSEGWDIDLMAHRRRGGAILGICAGYQMLGRTVADPQGIEGPPGEEAGLASWTTRPCSPPARHSDRSPAWERP